MVAFPNAGYFIIASRLRPGLDGGYTVATMRRALDFEKFGGVVPTILTVEFAPDVDELRDEFIRLGLATRNTVMRNLYADLRANPALLREAARARGFIAPVDPPLSQADYYEEWTGDTPEHVWKILTRNLDGAILFTDYLDSSGRRLLRLPYISGRSDWHRANIAIDVFDDDENIVGQIAGFGALYRLWIESVLAESGHDRNIVVCEAKQVGELLAVGPRSYSLVHTVHNAHTTPPFAWDSPIDDLWSGWFDSIDDMDAVIWLTEAQRADVVRRFGEHANWLVVPHPAEQLPSAGAPTRDRNRVVMIARLVEQKRVADAIEAWPAVIERLPDARLDVYGDGPHRGALEARITELGLADRVVLHGHVPSAVAELESAGALLLTSRHEGQPLVILEALAHGIPVIAYDVHYGPADMIEDGRTGVLVESGNRAALVDAIETVIGDAARNAGMSVAALDWAHAHGPEVSMGLMADLFDSLLAVEPAEVRTS